MQGYYVKKCWDNLGNIEYHVGNKVFDQNGNLDWEF